MSLGVTFAVLLAAVLHAGWNVAAKAIPDRLASTTLLGLGMAVVGAVAVLLLAPPDPASWPFLAASVVLQTGYLVLLTAAYHHADFATAYPLARGLAVLLVGIVSATVLGEHLAPLQVVGVGVIVAALLSLVVVGRDPGCAGSAQTLGLWLAVATGVVVATYTLVDGVGVRRSGSTPGYAAWLFLAHGLTAVGAAALLARGRPSYRPVLRVHWPVGIAAGMLSVVAYGIVLWAQSVAPLALVSALRETSVLLAGVLGFLFFHEPFRTSRTVATVAALVGVIALQVGG